MATIINSVHKVVPASELDKKQDKLVSGQNIKTLNGEPIIGSGNIVLVPDIMHLPWKTNVSTTRLQIPAGMRSRGVKISYNNAAGTYIVEQYNADDISDSVWGSNDNWKGCRTPMTPLFETSGARFNDETGYYELNELVDITENQMLVIHKFTYGLRIKMNSELNYEYTRCRTNLPPLYGLLMDINTCRLWDSTMVVLNLVPLGKNKNTVISWSGSFSWHGTECRKVLGVIKPTSNSFYNNAVSDGFSMLEDIRIMGLSDNFGKFSDSKNITVASWSYIINNASNTKAITITVHPNIYAKIIDPTNTEWYAVNEAAIAKQISFATKETQSAVSSSEDQTIQTADGEMLAPAGYYITQSKETPIEERLFFTRKVMLPNEDMNNWRIATPEEQQAQEDYFKSQLPEMPE